MQASLTRTPRGKKRKSEDCNHCYVRPRTFILTIPFSSIDQMLGSITYQAVKGLEVEYEMLMNDGPDGDVSYLVLFSLDVNGVWRISFF